MLVVGRYYRRKHPEYFREPELLIQEYHGKYFRGEDCNHYNAIGQRGAGGVYKEYDLDDRKWDLIIPVIPSTEEMLKAVM